MLIGYYIKNGDREYRSQYAFSSLEKENTLECEKYYSWFANKDLKICLKRRGVTIVEDYKDDIHKLVIEMLEKYLEEVPYVWIFFNKYK